jgi:GAF domain-containing protein
VRPFSDADAELVHLVADLVAAALALRESTEHQAARSDHDGALATAARALATESDLHAVLEAVARAAVEALGGGMSGVYLRQDDGSGVATAGYHSPPEWEGYVMRPGEGVAGQVLATGRVAIANAYQSEVQLPENTGLRRLQTAVSVPMVLDGRLVGALSIGFIRMRRVGDGDLRTLQALADLAAVACRTSERR